MKDDNSVGIIAFNCPQCRHYMDRVSEVSGIKVAPTPGDVTLCIGCGALLIFNESGSVRPANREDVATMMSDRGRWAMIERARAAIALLHIAESGTQH